MATDDELNSATKIGSGPKWSAEHGPLLSGSLNKYLKWEGILLLLLTCLFMHLCVYSKFEGLMLRIPRLLLLFVYVVDRLWLN